MRARLLSYLRSTPATAIALVALVLATTGVAVAKPPTTDPPGQDEVTLVTLTGGPVDTTTPGIQVAIPLNGAPTFVFTQKAGEAIELILTVTETSTANFCNMAAIVYGDGIPLGARVDVFSNKGEVGLGSAIGGLPAAATDTIVTLKAITMETDSSCDEDVYDDDGIVIIDSGPDTWSVSVRVTIVTLRN